MRRFLIGFIFVCAIAVGGCDFLGSDKDDGTTGDDGSSDGSGDQTLVEERP